MQYVKRRINSLKNGAESWVNEQHQGIEDFRRRNLERLYDRVSLPNNEQPAAASFLYGLIHLLRHAAPQREYIEKLANGTDSRVPFVDYFKAGLRQVGLDSTLFEFAAKEVDGLGPVLEITLPKTYIEFHDSRMKNYQGVPIVYRYEDELLR